MSVARVALLCASLAALGCGERAGDPVIQLPADQSPDGGEPGAAAAEPGAMADPGAGSVGQQGPTGLCGRCNGSDECGDANDACIRHQGQRFCGRDCDDQHGCPDGYSCVELDNSQLWQCVPQNGCPTAAVAVPTLADVRQYVRGRINSERAIENRPALNESSCLDDLAQGSAVAFALTDEPLGKFVKECDPIWPNCNCGWSAEAELTVARYALDWTTAVDSALATSRDSQNLRFTQAFLDSDGTDLGIGFWLSGDEAWIALSFH